MHCVQHSTTEPISGPTRIPYELWQVSIGSASAIRLHDASYPSTKHRFCSIRYKRQVSSHAKSWLPCFWVPQILPDPNDVVYHVNEQKFRTVFWCPNHTGKGRMKLIGSDYESMLGCGKHNDHGGWHVCGRLQKHAAPRTQITHLWPTWSHNRAGRTHNTASRGQD